MATTIAAQSLAQSGLMKVLTPEARERLLAQGRVVRLEPNTTLFEKGDPGDGLYIVVEGEIEVGAVSEGGRTVRFAALGAGEVLGELAAIDAGPRSADARATRRTSLIKISRDALLEILADEPGAALALLTALARRVREVDQQIETHALLDLAAKAAKLLLEESAHGARVVALTQTEMARRIHVSREKLNRRLHAWVDEGFVSVGRTGVKVLAPDKLAGLMRRKEND
jgi:CRP-like cAMP-binding protein